MKSIVRLSAIALVAGFAALSTASLAEARPNNRMVHIDEDTGRGYWDGRHDGIVCTYGWRWTWSNYAGRYVQVRGRSCGRYW